MSQEDFSEKVVEILLKKLDELTRENERLKQHFKDNYYIPNDNDRRIAGGFTVYDSSTVDWSKINKTDDYDGTWMTYTYSRKCSMCNRYVENCECFTSNL